MVAMVGALLVKPEDEIMLISSGGTLVRTQVSEISVQGRNTQGVRLIRVDEGDRLVGLERIVAEGAPRAALKAAAKAAKARAATREGDAGGDARPASADAPEPTQSAITVQAHARL